MSSRRTSNRGLKSARAWLSRRALASTAPLETNELMRSPDSHPHASCRLSAGAARGVGPRLQRGTPHNPDRIPTVPKRLARPCCAEFRTIEVQPRSPAMSLIGRTAEVTLRLDPPDSAEASSLPSRRFPAVLATSQLIGLMELAAVRCMQPQLADGQSSVSIVTNVRHAALAGLQGTQLRIVANCRAIAGRLYLFEVNAFDAKALV